LTPLDDTPYRRMGMSYQVEEIVVPALAHVVGSGITVDCGIMYVPNGWWKHMWATAWFGASLQERRRLQSVLWYDGWSCLFTST
jgi:hypothetical protein